MSVSPFTWPERQTRSHYCCTTTTVWSTTARRTPRNARPLLALLRRLVERGSPIGAFGLQAHLDADLTTFNPTVLHAFLDQVGDLGPQVLVTELDVRDAALPGDTASRDAGVAQLYAAFLAAVLPHPTVLGVLTWGLSDRYHGSACCPE